ncbi:hypothetical protein MTR67_052703 [Solanum verrucosum]|uniref:Uncharacterized protein n=1 Tax=Solanum verrucosum TaxID=315347 RepID=A0AAF0V5K1_SOLVR|nr:hypothetical protein MTR67_052703 [Solanum verrucosum]
MRRTTFSRKTMEWLVFVLRVASKDSGPHIRRWKLNYVRASKWPTKESAEARINTRNISGGAENLVNGFLERCVVGSFSEYLKEKPMLADI